MSDTALSALRALQAATGEDVAAGASNLPNIPAVPATDDAALANWMSSVKAWLEAANAAGATGFATKADLIQAGVLKQDAQGNVTPTVPASAAVPPAPSGLTADGAVESIIVSWSNPMLAYVNHAYAEVWASGDANFTNAVMVGQSAGFMFAHVTGDSAQRWYWVRFVSTSGVKGPFSAVNGVPGASAAVDPAAIFSAIEGSALAGNPFFTITPAMVTAGTNVVNGIALPAGTYIKEAFVAAATISRAMIRDAAIDNAKIANLDATKINAGVIAAERIGVRSIVAEKIATGTLTANEIAAGAITADKIAAGAITAGKVAANSITAANGAIADLSVSTLKIQDQAVTFPVYAEALTQYDTGVMSANSSTADMLTATISASGAPIQISGILVIDQYVSLVGVWAIQIYRDGSLLRTIGEGTLGYRITDSSSQVCSFSLPFPFALSDTPSQGTHTYSLRVFNWPASRRYKFGFRSLLLLETKK